MKKVAVILSGCGYLDGAEITESVSLLIQLSELGVDYEVFAPNKELNTTAHFSEDLSTHSKRNCLEEAGRIARGKVRDLSELAESRYDGLAFPGGFGVAKNLCSWAREGAACSVDPKIKETIEQFHGASKPILAICIAPALIARVLGSHGGLSLTIGKDPATAAEIKKTGTDHVDCEVTDFVTDREFKVISTPAYMYEAKPHEVFKGISRATREFIEMC